MFATFNLINHHLPISLNLLQLFLALLRLRSSHPNGTKTNDKHDKRDLFKEEELTKGAGCLLEKVLADKVHNFFVLGADDAAVCVLVVGLHQFLVGYHNFVEFDYLRS